MKTVMVYGASSNGFGDIDCGYKFFNTMRGAKNYIRREAKRLFCGNDEFDPEVMVAVQKGLKNNKVIVGTDISGADYDYIWKIVELDLECH